MSWKKNAGMLFLVALLSLAPALLHAFDIKIGSVAPENSPYGSALNRLAAEWHQLSNGRIRVIIYHDGIAGNQADILRKMRIGQLQGGVFSNIGIGSITRDVLSLSVPFLVHTDDESDFVLDRFRSTFEEKLEAQGYVSVAWARAGWLYLFTRNPVKQPTDLRPLRIGIPPEEGDLVDTFKAMGYRPIGLDLPETLSALNSGLVDAIFSSPLIAAGYQWFVAADNMMNMKIAPVYGCILLSRSAWNRIPKQYAAAFLDAARSIEGRLQVRLAGLDGEAIRIMRQYGLTVTPISPAAFGNWTDEFEKNRDAVINSAFDRQSVSLLERYLREFRSGEK
jgi:TRAP-type C4-dicarboxylate transport system substrate-binding protein